MRYRQHYGLVIATMALLISSGLASCNRPAPEAEAPALDATATPQSSPTAPPSQDTQPLEVTRALLAAELQLSKPWKIAYVLKTTNPQSPYTLRVKDGAIAAGEQLGVDVQIFTTGKEGPVPEFVEDQIKEILKVIDQGDFDGMVIAPAESVRVAPVIERAIAAGIPTIAMDTPVNTDRILSYVKFDNFAVGKAIGEWVVEQLGGSGKVVILNGPLEQQNAVDRRDGFLDGLKSGNIEVLAMESASWELAAAQEITRRWLAEFSEIDALISANDRMAIGAIEEIAAANRQGILVTGLDAVEAGLQAIQQGQLALTVDQRPETQALLAVKMLVLHLEGQQTFPAITPVPDIPLVTAENVEDYL